MTTKKEWLFLAPLSLLAGITQGITVIATTWWLKSAGISYTKIGIFTISNLAYSFRVIWVPLFDQIKLRDILKWFGIDIKRPIQRKGFILITVIATSISLYMASFANPKVNIMSLAIPILMANFWRANAESVMNAYVGETIRPPDMGMSTAAYRIGSFMASALSLFVYENFGITWPTIFRIASILSIILVLSILFAPSEQDARTKTFREAFVQPYRDILKQYGKSILLVIGFMGLYKLQERFAAPMDQLFLRNECDLGSVGFFVLKFISTFALAFSAVKSGPIIKRFGYRWSFGISIIANACMVLCYFLHTCKMTACYIGSLGITAALLMTFAYITSQSIPWTYIASFTSMGLIALLNPDSFMSWLPFISAYAIVVGSKMIAGIRASLLYSYQYTLCSREHVLTQLTLLLSLERIIAGESIQTLSGYFVDKFGWSGFYLVSFIFALAPLLVLRQVVKREPQS